MIDADDFIKASQALDHHGFDRIAGKRAGQAVRKAANVVRRSVRQAARSHRRTGKMAQRISVKVQGYGLDTEARVHAGGVAPIIVGGSRPHDLAPINSRALAMTSTGQPGGPLIGFATAVHHPGTRPDPFVARGIDEARADVQRTINEAAGAMLAELATRLEGRRR